MPVPEKMYNTVGHLQARTSDGLPAARNVPVRGAATSEGGGHREIGTEPHSGVRSWSIVRANSWCCSCLTPRFVQTEGLGLGGPVEVFSRLNGRLSAFAHRNVELTQGAFECRLAEACALVVQQVGEHEAKP